MGLILTRLCRCSYAAIRFCRILVSPGSLVGGRSFVTTVRAVTLLFAPLQAASRPPNPMTPTPATAVLRMNARRESGVAPEVCEAIWVKLLYGDTHRCVPRSLADPRVTSPGFPEVPGSPHKR